MNEAPADSSRDRIVASALAAATVLLRLPALRALPVFGDEAIHLHWAQLVRRDFSRFAFVSLQDPKPPFHFWVLALALRWVSDPVLAGRLLSVICGGVSTALFFFLVRDLFRIAGVESGRCRRIALLGSVLFLLCPFIAFHHRIALTESLFILEAIAAAWLSVRLAAAAGAGRPVGGRALALGIVLGTAMLTRQDFSYVLWALPPLAWWLARAPGRRALPAFAIAAATALLVWSPVFFSAIGPDWKTRVFHSGVYRERVSLSRRAAEAGRLLGWLGAYLSPPVALLAIAGGVLLARRHGRAAGFVIGWWFVCVAPLAVLASLLFPRYVLPAALPLLIAAAVALDALVDRGFHRAPAVTIAAVVLLLAWPARDLVLAWEKPADPPLVAIDRWQYVSGWPAGGATERAVRRIQELAAHRPLVLIAPQISGNPGDSVWLLLAKDPRVRVRTAVDYLDGPVLRPDGAGRFLLRGDFRAGEPDRAVVLPGDTRVYFIATDPLATRAGWVSASEFLAARNPGLQEIARFVNPADATRPPAGIVLFRVR